MCARFGPHVRHLEGDVSEAGGRSADGGRAASLGSNWKISSVGPPSPWPGSRTWWPRTEPPVMPVACVEVRALVVAFGAERLASRTPRSRSPSSCANLWQPGWCALADGRARRWHNSPQGFGIGSVSAPLLGFRNKQTAAGINACGCRRWEQDRCRICVATWPHAT